MVTMRDIAKAVGVSQGAVSVALNGKSGVGAATRAKILKVAEELGYRPDPLAGGAFKPPLAPTRGVGDR